MSDASDISTDRAYLEKLLSDSALFAGQLATAQAENRRLLEMVAYLRAALLFGVFVIGWLWFQLDTRVEVNEVLIHKLMEAR